MGTSGSGMRVLRKGALAFCAALIAVAVSFCLAASDNGRAFADEAIGTPATSEDAGIAAYATEQTGTLSITGTSSQTEARKILSMVNTARANATTKASALTWDYNLEKAAIQRAAELAIYFSHTRPSNQDCFTAISGTYYAMGENIHASTGSSNATTANTAWTNSPGHYANMVNTDFTCMAAAMFSSNGVTYWVELFGDPNRASSATTAVNGSRTVSIQVAPSIANLSFSSALAANAKVGTSATYAVVNTNRGWSASKVVVNNSSFNWTSSSTSLATVNASGVATVKGAGTVTITATCKTLSGIKVSKATKTTAAATTTVKAGWVQSGNRWWYRNADGTYPKSCAKVIGGKTYRFDASGWMRTGWVKEGSNWYWHGAWNDGAMKTGWVMLSGHWYYLNPSNGVMKTGWYNDTSGRRFYSDSSGVMKTGWLKSGGSWYWLQSNGAMAKGWVLLGRTWYYLNPADGVMKTGFYDVSGKRYYSDSSGAMKTGWVKASNKWYWFDGSGAMAKNRWISGIYWVGSDGVMATSAWVDNNRYYVNANGVWVPNKSKSSSATQAAVVYWPSSGNTYHTTICASMKNAKGYSTGTLAQAKAAGHTNKCKVCP